MSAAFIIDCSITMTWCFDDEATPQADAIAVRLAQETALVPSLWFLEVANVLALAEKGKRITQAESEEFLARLGGYDIEVDHEITSRAFGHLLPLSRGHGLTIYDAAYLDVALRRQLPLASLDEQLRREALALGLTVLGK